MNSSGSPLSPELAAQLRKLDTNLEVFCAKALRIKLKAGGDGPFTWNKAQKYLHDRIEKQLATTGTVRMFIIKGRQQGISTYIAARLYHKITRSRPQNVFILSHHAVTTEILFQIVDKYHASCPDYLTTASTVNNNRRMRFQNGSQYTVGTAGSGAVGRGDTNQLFHGSEAAFWENVGELLTGVVQTVADVPGTEKYFESTANGVGNFFHTGCMEAMNNPEDPYELVFTPWYWQDEYTAKPAPNFQATPDEELLRHQIDPEGNRVTLTDGQLQWRRNKIAEFKKDGFGEKKFKQEYPFTVAEAFQSSGTPLVDPDKVAEARKSKITDPNAPLILGVDPGPVNDRTVISWRRGRHWEKIETHIGNGPMTMAGRLATIIARDRVDKCFIDIAEGRGIVDRLHELGYGDIVIGIPFGMKPIDDERYVNKRAEMAGEFKEWVEDETGARIPDRDDIAIDIGAIPEWKPTSNGLLQLPSKDSIKKTYGRSPDIFDSIILTFAQPVRREASGQRVRKKPVTRTTGLAASRARHRATEPRRNVFDDEYDMLAPKPRDRNERRLR